MECTMCGADAELVTLDGQGVCVDCVNDFRDELDEDEELQRVGDGDDW